MDPLKPDRNLMEAAAAAPAPDILALYQQLERYRDLYDLAPVGYFVLDANGVIEEVNRTGSRQLGLPALRLLGRRFGLYLDDASRTHFEIFLRRVFAGEGPQRVELKLAPAAGAGQHVQLDAVKCPAHEFPPCCRVTLTDISTLKTAQESVSAQNNLLEQRVENRNAQIRELNAELESFVQTVTRELQDPLRQATTLADVLRSAGTLTPDRAEHYSKVMLERVEHMNTLLAALQGYFRLGRQRARFVPVSLERVLADVKKQLKPNLRAVQVTWYQEPLPTVTGDSRSLQTIFHELLSNALKFRRPGDPVHLSILKRETDTEYHIGVQDNGLGFNMRHKDKIFGIFYRLNSDKEFAGLGVGLPLVRRAVMRHGGRVWAESRDGAGSTFWVALPKQPTLNL